MADLRKAVAQNVPGDFFVDSTCIDCDTCRQVAPRIFEEGEDTSFVAWQPTNCGERRDALRALLACPTGSIGCIDPHDVKSVMQDFPLRIDDGVFYCGYSSPDSYGAHSYFLTRPEGNWMVDSPKFVLPLVRRLEELGGVSAIFLTHRDDVADAEKYAAHFGARRIIHREELEAQPNSELVLDGLEATPLAADLLAIPTPGHTTGHCCLLFRNRFLFTGDHLGWSRDRQRLHAYYDYCWHSWAEQTKSMRRLQDYSFEWVLPGHGQRVELDCGNMATHLRDLVHRMSSRLQVATAQG